MAGSFHVLSRATSLPRRVSQLYMPLTRHLQTSVRLPLSYLNQARIYRALLTMPPASLKRVTSTDRDISPPASKRRVTTTTTPNAVNNFFKPASQKEPEKVTFNVFHDTLLIGRYQDAHKKAHSRPVKIAAFDFDDTVIATKSGNRFSKGPDDWRWWHASVPGRLKQLHDEGHIIVVLSNQGGISLKSDAKSKTPKGDMKSLNNFKGKVTAVLNALDLPVTVYAATGADGFRKPRTGMWAQLLTDYGLSDVGDIVHEECLFVGDAAGREAEKQNGTGGKKDHSCSDRDFAANLSLPFQTPEEFFLGEPGKPFKRTFDPKKYLDVEVTSATDSTPLVFTKKHPVELVLFCGSPGAGKSTFYWHHLQPLGYERVNQDTLKTRDKCIKVASQLLEMEGKSVVVDNTNADVETRAAWVALAKKLGVPVRVVLFTASAKLCEHNDTVRALNGDLVRRNIPPGFTHSQSSRGWS